MDEPVFVPRDGKPELDLDFEQLDKLLEIQCTLEECAAILDVSPRTLEERVKLYKKMMFCEYAEQKKSVGKMSLRRKQWLKGVKRGDNTMLIWLGKQYLNQSDKSQERREVILPQLDFEKQRAEWKELVEAEARKLLDGGYVPRLPEHSEKV
ncbi:MAG: hypothetical protein PHX83_12160 [Acidobacteriia bacterium]|nr:hypothetical protein [Terriglobia bacterium]